MAKPKPIKTTDKQKRFIQAKVEHPGISDRQAALQAGYAPETADNASRNITERPGVQAFLKMLAPDDKVAKVLNEGLDAWKQDQYTGGLLPDFGERRQYAKEIATLKGYHNEQVTQVNVGEMSLTFIKADGEAGQ